MSEALNKAIGFIKGNKDKKENLTTTEFYKVLGKDFWKNIEINESVKATELYLCLRVDHNKIKYEAKQSAEEALERVEEDLLVEDLDYLGGFCPVQYEGKDKYGREVFVRIRWEQMTIYLDNTPVYSGDIDTLDEIEPILDRLDKARFNTSKLREYYKCY